MYNNTAIPITDKKWTVSNTTISTTVYNPPATSSIAANTPESYTYFNMNTFSNILTSLKASKIQFDIYTTTNNIVDFYFGCNSSGVGQMWRLDTRTSHFSGFASTSSWTSWTNPTFGLTLTANTWYTIVITIDASGTATFTYNGILASGSYKIADSGTYIGVQADGLNGGYVCNISYFMPYPYSSDRFTTYSSGYNYGIRGITFDNLGNLYVCSPWGDVQKMDPAGNKTSVGGYFNSTNTLYNTPENAAYDNGFLYIMDDGNTLYKVDVTLNTRTNFTALNTHTFGLVFDKNHNIYYSSPTNNIYKIDSDGTTTTFINGTGVLSNPMGLAFDYAGNLYICNGSNIAQYSESGTLVNATYISLPNNVIGNIVIYPDPVDPTNNTLYICYKDNTFTGINYSYINQYDGTGTFVSTLYYNPSGFIYGLALDNVGNLYFTNEYNGNYSNVVTKYVTNPSPYSVYADGLLTNTADRVLGIAFDSSNNLYIASTADNNIWKVDVSGNKTVFATGLTYPENVVFDATGFPNGYMYVMDSLSIYKVDASGNKTVFLADFSSSHYYGFLCDKNNNLYYSSDDGCIYKIAPDKTITTFISLGLSYPIGIAFDSYGNLYIVDIQSPNISKYDSSGTLINANFISFTGATFMSSIANDTWRVITVDKNNNIYAIGGQYVYKFDINGQFVSIIYHYGGFTLTCDNFGNVYFANSDYSQIIKYSTTAPPTNFSSYYMSMTLGNGIGNIFNGYFTVDNNTNLIQQLYDINNMGVNILEFQQENAGYIDNVFEFGNFTLFGISLSIPALDSIYNSFKLNIRYFPFPTTDDVGIAFSGNTYALYYMSPNIWSYIDVSCAISFTSTTRLASGPQYYYKFDKGDINSSNQLANYASGTAVYDATVFGGASINTTNQVVGSGCLYLNGALSQYIKLPSFTSYTNGITISCWFKVLPVTGSYTNGHVFDLCAAGGTNENIFYSVNSGNSVYNVSSGIGSNLVTNGDFSSPALAANSISSSNPTGWSTLSSIGAVVNIGNGFGLAQYLPPSPYSQYVIIGVSAKIYKPISLIANINYTLSFYMIYANNYYDTGNKLSISFGYQVIASSIQPVTTSWVQYTYTFAVSTSQTNDLYFSSVFVNSQSNILITGITLSPNNDTLAQTVTNASTGGYADSNWHLQVWTMSSTGSWNVYIDNVLEYTDSSALYPDAANRTSNFLGKSNVSTDPYFNGYIDEYRYYNRVLDSSEIANLYLTGFDIINSDSGNVYQDAAQIWDMCSNLVSATQTTTLTNQIGYNGKDLANLFVLYSNLSSYGYTGVAGTSCNYSYKLTNGTYADIGSLFVKKGTIPINTVVSQHVLSAIVGTTLTNGVSYTFTSPGNITLFNMQNTTIEMLAVGGGGAGGSYISYFQGGGGGGGGVMRKSYTITSNQVTIMVNQIGAGGVPTIKDSNNKNINNGGQGGYTQFTIGTTVYNVGGGGGGANGKADNNSCIGGNGNVLYGGSGGGSTYNSITTSSANTVGGTIYANAGGAPDGSTYNYQNTSGGGGGAVSGGGNGTQNNAGNGGDGYTFTVTTSSVTTTIGTYGGGGGGGGCAAFNTIFTPGVGGAGNSSGYGSTHEGGSATPNTGGGGGGGGGWRISPESNIGGTGGSGVYILYIPFQL